MAFAIGWTRSLAAESGSLELATRWQADLKGSLREIVHTLVHVTPVITLHTPLDGFEREVLRLLEKSRLVPGARFAVIDADMMFDDDHFDVRDGETLSRVLSCRATI